MKKLVWIVALLLLPLSALSQSWAQYPSYKAVRLGGENMKRVEAHHRRVQELGEQLLQEADTTSLSRERVCLMALIVSTLSVEAQAMGEKPATLDSLVAVLTAQLNDRGYWGEPCGKKMDERQWACNGLVLDALCHYHDQRRNSHVKKQIATLASNFYAPHVEQLKRYTLSPRKWWSKLIFWNRKGRGWTFSKERGELMIALNGLVHARDVLRDSTLNTVTDAFTTIAANAASNRQVPVQYRTAALRAMLRIAEQRDDDRMARQVLENYNALLSERLTAGYEVSACDTATQVAATADAYTLANELWRYNRDPRLAELAQLIYYNGLCAMQTSFGDFTSHNVPQPGNPYLYTVATTDTAGSIHAGIALSSPCRVWMAALADTLYINNFATSVAGVDVKDERISLLQTTKYPLDEKSVQLMALTAAGDTLVWRILIPHWMKNVRLTMNEEQDTSVHATPGQYLTLPLSLKEYGTLVLDYEDASLCQPWDSKVPYPAAFSSDDAIAADSTTRHRVYCGALLLGCLTDSATGLPQHVSLEHQRPGQWRVKKSKVKLQPVHHMMQHDALPREGKPLQLLFPTRK